MPAWMVAGVLAWFLPFLVLGLVAVLPLQALAGEQPGGSAVATVSLVVGPVKATGVDGVSRILDRGSAVRLQDRIDTAAGGHVHLQFVDGARMSVRPMSRLVIEDYRRPEDGGEAAIRFKLEEGVVRSITGQWGEAAKDRFRLNTPLAAIGVKGTDFAVRADALKTAASVYSGAIVVAALDSSCALTVGPCANGSEKLLTASMKGQMIELGRTQVAPQFVPAVDLLASSLRSAPLATGVAVNARAEAYAQPAAGPNAASPGGEKASSIDRPLTEALAEQAARQASAAPAPVFQQKVEVPQIPAPPVVSQLFWGRSAAVAEQGDLLSQPSEGLIAAGARPTVGTYTYTLFTSAAPVAPGAVIGSGESVVNFRLAGAHAGFTDYFGQAIETVKVTAGQLSIDFARALFDTRLSLSGAQLGAESLAASGAISSSGYFYNAQGAQFVAGAVTPNGKEVGYVFEKRVTPGVIRGITLWGR